MMCTIRLGIPKGALVWVDDENITYKVSNAFVLSITAHFVKKSVSVEIAIDELNGILKTKHNLEYFRLK